MGLLAPKRLRTVGHAVCCGPRVELDLRDISGDFAKAAKDLRRQCLNGHGYREGLSRLRSAKN